MQEQILEDLGQVKRGLAQLRASTPSKNVPGFATRRVRGSSASAIAKRVGVVVGAISGVVVVIVAVFGVAFAIVAITSAPIGITVVVFGIIIVNVISSICVASEITIFCENRLVVAIILTSAQ